MKQQKIEKESDFVEDIDYYFENGYMVLTAFFHEKRGYCCGNGCRHCPYPKENPADHNKKVSSSSFDS